MTYQNHSAIFSVHEKRVVALLVKASIAYRKNLIDQKTFKIDGDGEGER